MNAEEAKMKWCPLLLAAWRGNMCTVKGPKERQKGKELIEASQCQGPDCALWVSTGDAGKTDGQCGLINQANTGTSAPSLGRSSGSSRGWCGRGFEGTLNMKTTEVLLETIEQHGRTILAHKPKPWDSKNPAVAHWLRLHGLSARVAAQIGVDNAQAERLMGELESELAWAHWIP